MSGRLFLKWLAYYGLEPWGESRADLRSAQIVATILNLFRGRGKPPAKAEDYVIVPPVGKARRSGITDPAAIQAMFKGMAAKGIGTWQDNKASSET